METETFAKKLNELVKQFNVRLIARIPVKEGQSIKDAILDLPPSLEVPIQILSLSGGQEDGDTD